MLMSRMNLLFTQTTFANELIINGDEYAVEEEEVGRRILKVAHKLLHSIPPTPPHLHSLSVLSVFPPFPAGAQPTREAIVNTVLLRHSVFISGHLLHSPVV